MDSPPSHGPERILVCLQLVLKWAFSNQGRLSSPPLWMDIDRSQKSEVLNEDIQEDPQLDDMEAPSLKLHPSDKALGYPWLNDKGFSLALSVDVSISGSKLEVVFKLGGKILV